VTAWWRRFTWAALTEAFRERRRRLLGHEPEPTFFTYPDRRTAPEMRFFLQVHGPDGRLMVEEVDLARYDFDNTPWQLKEPTACAVFVGDILDAAIRLRERRDKARQAWTRAHRANRSSSSR
jgi:hypothetical protein